MSSLAWPLVIGWAVWLFKTQLADLMPKLRVKHGEFSLDFRLDKAEEDAKALPPSEEQAVKPTPEQKSRFAEPADISARAAILETRAEVEAAMQVLARAAGMDRI